MQIKYVSLLKKQPEFDYVKWRRTAIVVSTLVNLAVLFGAAVWPGLNYGVDFAGGTELQVKFDKAVEVGQVREEIEKLGFGEPNVQTFGEVTNNEMLVRVERIALLTPEKAEAAKQQIGGAFPGNEMTTFHFDPEVGDKIDVTFKQPVDEGQLRSVAERAGLNPKEIRSLTAREGQPREYTIIAQGPGDEIGGALKKRFGADDVHVVRTEYVGPQVGKQLRTDGILAVLYAIGMILIYVGFRFDFRFSPGVVAAILHDAIITLGFFVVTRHEFNLTSITVILTVVGYSVNDTIVVYDRIRENAHRFKGKSLRDLVNLSINEMFERTILTSTTTALSLVGLLIYGVGTIWDFAAAMLVGIISGTYSTWFIAAPMTIWLEERAERRKELHAATPKKHRKGEQAAAAR